MTIQLNGIAIPSTDGMTLTYAVTTNPNPLQIDTTGSISIAVSKSAPPPAHCTSLTFSINTGTAAADLTTDPSTISAAPPPNWGVSSDGNGTFTFTPNPGQDEIGSIGLSFVLSNIAVNSQVGTTALYITETLQSGTSHGSLSIPKFPQNFTVSDLVATPANVAPGGTVNLSWNGTAGGAYTLSYGSQSISNLPNIDNYPISNLQQTTTFTLTVNAEGGTLQLQRQCTVTVLSPQIGSFGIVGNPTYVEAGSTLRLYWTTESVDHCMLSQNGIPISGLNNLPATAASSPGYPITAPAVSGDYEYTLTAFPSQSNAGGVDSSTFTSVFKFNVLPNPLVLPQAALGMIIDPGASLLFAVGDLLYLISTAQQQIVNSLSGYLCSAAVFSADGSQVYCAISTTSSYPAFQIQSLSTSTYQLSSTAAPQPQGMTYTGLAQGSAPGSMLVASVAGPIQQGAIDLYVLDPSNNCKLVHQISVLQTSSLPLTSIVANPQGDQLLVCANGNLYIYQPNSNTLSSSLLPSTYQLKTVILSADGNHYYVSGVSLPSHQPVILIVDAAQKQIISTVDLSSGVRWMVAAPSEACLYALLEDNTIARINLGTASVAQSFQVGTAPTALVMDAKGTHLYILDSVQNSYPPASKLWTVEIADPATSSDQKIAT